jgi:hypothetical protein
LRYHDARLESGQGRTMKFWFSRKSGKAPYDATVEQTLLFAQEVNATSEDANEALLDLATALRQPEHAAPAPQAVQRAKPVPAPLRRAAGSSAMREELQRRSADYRAFQLKLNEAREERIRKTMADVRASLKAAAQATRPLH